MKKRTYKEIAERYIESADQQITKGINIQEVVGFSVYHAFESMGMAFIVKFHPNFNIRCSHPRKLNTFMSLYRSRTIASVNPRTISQIAIRMMSYREKFLYPDVSGPSIKSPKDQITIRQAERLKRSIRGIINRINSNI